MDIDKSGYWKPHVSNSPALPVPKTSKAVAARKKKIMFPLTYLQSSTEILSMEIRI